MTDQIDPQIPVIDPDAIKVRSRKGSAMLALTIALGVAATVALIFLAVHFIIVNNNAQSNKQRDFARNITCQVINGESKANSQEITNLIPNLSTKQAAQIQEQYELRVSEAIEKNLGLTGRALVNSDGSINCQAYVRIGNRTTPLSSTTTSR